MSQTNLNQSTLHDVSDLEVYVQTLKEQIETLQKHLKVAETQLDEKYEPEKQ
jgi:chaperonin cofactor prefoldin